MKGILFSLCTGLIFAIGISASESANAQSATELLNRSGCVSSISGLPSAAKRGGGTSTSALTHK